MGQFSIVHILFFLIIVLIFFGPGRLPGLGKSLGEAIRGFKKGLEGDGNQQPPQQANNNQHQHPGPNQQIQSRHVSPIELSEGNDDNRTSQTNTRKTDNYS